MHPDEGRGFRPHQGATCPLIFAGTLPTNGDDDAVVGDDRGERDGRLNKKKKESEVDQRKVTIICI